VGSEARFVPLPQLVCRQVQAYVQHLDRLSTCSRVAKDIRAHALWICSFFKDSKTAGSSFSAESLLSLGFLFQINANATARTLTTRDVELALRKLGISFETGVSRRQIAQYILDRSHGGKCVQAFLGHQPEYHAFGPRSSWNVLEWASTLRPTQTRYLESLGLENHLFPRQPDKTIATKSICLIKPSHAMSMNGYEGRDREGTWAAQRARQAVRSVMGEIDLASLSMVVDNDLVKALHAKIEAEMPTDHAARKKISLELAKYLDRLREAGLTKVQSAIVNLQPTDVGPVDLDFARSLRIAKSFRLDWLGAMGQPLGISGWDRTERLAQLCINLVVQDAVLVPDRLAQLVDAVSTGQGVAIYKDQICLRGQVSTRKAKFETSVSLSVSSMAFVLGCQKSADVGAAPISWKEVDSRVSTILRKLLGQPVGVKGWKTASLCHFFRAYWFPRLPGFLYSIAIGAHNGPAVDEKTERNLFEDQPLSPGVFSLSVLRSTSSLKFKGETPQEQAYVELNFLLKGVEGQLGDGSATKKNQRRELGLNLYSASRPGLEYWRQQQPIVDLLHGYLCNLLEEGGKRKMILAIGSIKNYFRPLAKGLLQLVWDQSFDDWSPDNYTKLYKNLEKPQSSKDIPTGTSIRTFHRYLQDSFDAPYCPYLSSVKPIPSRVRGSLVTAQQASDAINALLAYQSTQPYRLRRAALQIALCSGYGVRRMEAIALQTAAFDSEESQFLSIDKNRLRDLKSPASRRTIPVMLNAKKFKKLVDAAKAASSLAPEDRRFMFEEAGREFPIYSNAGESLIAYAAIRWSSGNDRSLLHSLRHTFGTQVPLSALVELPRHPATIRAIGRLCSESDSREAKALLPTPDNWPFQIDLMAKTMGHSGVDTLLDVYFHASSWMTAEYCAKQYLDSDLSDARLAGLLGKDRTVITKQRLAACKLSGDDVRNPNYIFVLSRVKAAHSGPPTALQVRSKAQSKKSNSDLSGQGEAINMIQFDRLLRHRNDHQLSVDQIIEYSTNKLGLPVKPVQTFFDAYRRAVTELGFDDFEFEKSDLVHQAGKYHSGMVRSLNKRERLLGVITASISEEGHGVETFKAFLAAWYSRVNVKKPLIVCISRVEVLSNVTLLQSIGVLRTQIKLSAYCARSDPEARALENDFPEMTFHAVGRASRGVKNAVVREFAIDIGQAKLAPVPDGRDFHRCLLIAGLALGCTS
jgi:integrase